MVVLTQARQLRFPPPPFSTSPSSLSSFLFDPTSLSLALMHSDSSFSLYPSISPFSSPPSPTTTTTTTTIVPPPSSSATFLRLYSTDTSRFLFLVSSPHLAGTSILLRFYVLRSNNQFTRAKVICNQSDLSFDVKKFGVVFRVNHGVSLKLVGSINVFTMYSASNSKVWVFAVKMAAEGDELKLMKSAVIDCELPVFSMSVSVGFLILGQENGVRVFPLRPLVKGRAKREHKRSVKKNADKLENNVVNLRNGMIRRINPNSNFHGNSGKITGSVNKSMNFEATLQNQGVSDGNMEENMRKRSDNTAKLRSVKLRQNSSEGGSCFVAFKSEELEKCHSSKVPPKSVNAISIQLLSQDKFLILDSVGELYLLSLSYPLPGSEMPYQIKKLTVTMKVQNLAALPDNTAKTQTVWMSDGDYTVYTMIVSNMDSSGNESDSKDNEEKIQSSAIQAIFTSEKVQEITPLSANSILILGQANSIFAYAIS